MIEIYIVFCLAWTVFTTIKHVKQPDYDNRKLWYTILLNLVVSPICIGYAIYNYMVNKYSEYKKLNK